MAKKPKKQKFNKKKLLFNLIEVPPRSKMQFYAKEMKLLNDLIDRYSEEFISVLTLPQKYDSIAMLLCPSYKKELDTKFRNFNYIIDDSKYEKFTLEKKSGEDIVIKKKPKTIRDFLNG